MIEEYGDIFKSCADIIVIPMHRSIDDDNNLVMVRGVMLRAKKLYPDLPESLGTNLLFLRKRYTMVVMTEDGQKIAGLTTSNTWCDEEPADISTIVKSAEQLVELIDECHPYPESLTIALPRLGCGGGRLDWKLVKSYLEPIFDDRFTVYNRTIED